MHGPPEQQQINLLWPNYVLLLYQKLIMWHDHPFLSALMVHTEEGERGMGFVDWKKLMYKIHWIYMETSEILTSLKISPLFNNTVLLCTVWSFLPTPPLLHPHSPPHCMKSHLQLEPMIWLLFLKTSAFGSHTQNWSVVDSVSELAF